MLVLRVVIVLQGLRPLFDLVQYFTTYRCDEFFLMLKCLIAHVILDFFRYHEKIEQDPSSDRTFVENVFGDIIRADAKLAAVVSSLTVAKSSDMVLPVKTSEKET